MKANNEFLGIDVGSVSISIVLLNKDKEIIQSAYGFHEGKIAPKLLEMLFYFKFKVVCGIASTSSTPSFVKSTAIFDNRVSVITAVKALHEKVGSILIVGGDKFGLIQFDEDEQYRKFKSNSSCAAGTGSFLVQQCKRLNIGSISEFAELASSNTGDFPKIASRCSVFAKTGLIHAQQEGYILPEICDGLCYGLAKNIVDTLFTSSNINQPMIFAGGVSLNSAVAKHIQELVGIEPVVGEYLHLYGAIGAALNLINEKPENPDFKIYSLHNIIQKNIKEKQFFYRPLKL